MQKVEQKRIGYCTAVGCRTRCELRGAASEQLPLCLPMAHNVAFWSCRVACIAAVQKRSIASQRWTATGMAASRATSTTCSSYNIYDTQHRRLLLLYRQSAGQQVSKHRANKGCCSCSAVPTSIIKCTWHVRIQSGQKGRNASHRTSQLPHCINPRLTETEDKNRAPSTCRFLSRRRRAPNCSSQRVSTAAAQQHRAVAGWLMLRFRATCRYKVPLSTKALILL